MRGRLAGAQKAKRNGKVKAGVMVRFQVENGADEGGRRTQGGLRKFKSFFEFENPFSTISLSMFTFTKGLSFDFLWGILCRPKIGPCGDAGVLAQGLRWSYFPLL